MNERRQSIRTEKIVEAIYKAVEKLEKEYDCDISYNIDDVKFL